MLVRYVTFDVVVNVDVLVAVLQLHDRVVDNGFDVAVNDDVMMTVMILMTRFR